MRRRLLAVAAFAGLSAAAGAAPASRPAEGHAASSISAFLRSAPAAPASRPARGYAGSQACSYCHRAEYEAWEGSHHEQAMQPATPGTVLADFDDAAFDYNGIRTRFRREGDRFRVRTDGPDGELTEYEVLYTFGVYPLQQYLIPLPGGRLQALDIAWDARPADQGGQRWYHLHPDDAVVAGDPLHWTGPNLNWNYMCADCHSTQIVKGYDAEPDGYATTWAEISVGCEACHGPSRAHVELGRMGKAGERLPPVRFDEREGVSWTRREDGLPVRSRPRSDRVEIDTCARCHARRSQLTDDVDPGPHLLDGFRPALISPDLYHADGQMRDEAYVWGSFMQSRMQHAGVTCSDCHDPHAATLRLPGNATCTQCHGAEAYDSAAHHFHPAGSAGAACAACHMPVNTFMGVDERHEHVFRVPRPDVAAALGTPDACTACHDGRDAAWAAAELVRRHGEPDAARTRFPRAMAAAWGGDVTAAPQLAGLAGDGRLPLMLRASALGALAMTPGDEAARAAIAALDAPEPLLRLAAARALEGFGPRQRVQAFGLLGDPRLAVRVEAAWLVSALRPGDLDDASRALYQSGIDDYLAVQRFSAERAEAQTTLAGFHVGRGEGAAAERAYRRALERQPLFVPARVGLAQLLAGAGRGSEARVLLRDGLERQPAQPDLYHALGLQLVRDRDLAAAIDALDEAARRAPDNVRYAYAAALALDASGERQRALAELAALHRRFPRDESVLLALATMHRDQADVAAALTYARQLATLRPRDGRYRALVTELEQAARD